MRWSRRSDWGPARLGADEWAPLQAQISAADLDAVEETLEELTGFMDPFREDVAGAPMVGVTDGQLAVVSERTQDTWGRPVLEVTLYAGGPVGHSSPDAFERLASAASALVDHLQAEGVAVDGIRWQEKPYIKRPF
ncbi:hypothetical protein [Nesterenkonia flava]|uniref:Uncharacterized protein n=1 Tax=Nesterenkonia flava TaxID=469799 RepID=A0ABU1FTA6_9MICC|nr:hypothetical protein [Nesterenkonia flava]MDR5711885.1 hypothetical protein [Nesterenkonia flava]